MRRSSWPVLLIAVIVLSACGSSAARYNNRGNEAFVAQKYDDALDDYTSAQRENPDLAEPYYNAGNAYHRKRDVESAATQLQQALRTADDKLGEQAYYNLGNTYFRAEDWPAAIKAYKQALLLNPDDLDAKHNLELALQKLQQQQQQQQQQQGQQGSEGDQQQENQGGQQNQQQQQGGQQNNQNRSNEEGQGQQDQQDQSGSSQQPEQQDQSGRSELTPEEAEQLLDALGQNSQTLQERLQQQYGDAPSLPPARDW